MNRFSRSSRATGPKIRVPRGSFWSFTITAVAAVAALGVVAVGVYPAPLLAAAQEAIRALIG